MQPLTETRIIRLMGARERVMKISHFLNFLVLTFFSRRFHLAKINNNLSCILQRIALFAFFFIGFGTPASAQFGGGGFGGGGATEATIETEYIERQSVTERLSAHGLNLLGESIDLNTGAVSFEHVDISLPGNSNLEVAIRRTRGQGWVFPHLDATNGSGPLAPQSSNRFSDWSLEVPRIAMMYEQGDGKNMCTSDRFGGTFYVYPGTNPQIGGCKNY